MLNVSFDEKSAVATLSLDGALEKEDFERVADTLDPFIERSGKLNGILIVTETFPGWETFGAFVSHIQFVKEHHKKVKAVAFVTDSVLGSVAESVAKHFVSAQIKHFAYAALDDAKAWIATESQL